MLVSTKLINKYSRGGIENTAKKNRAFPGKAWAVPSAEARIGELERVVGRLTMENDLLKKILQKLEDET